MNAPALEASPDDDLDGITTAIDAECAVLGALLHGARLEHRDQLAVDDFWRPRHQTIFAAVRDLTDRGDPADAVAVGEHLRAGEELLRVGGLPYLHTLMQAAPPGRAFGYHAGLVTAAATRRRLRDAALAVQQLAEHPGTGDIAALLERARGELDQVAGTSNAHDRHGDRGVYLDDLLTARTLAYEQPQRVGMRTGWRDLDEILGGGSGLQPGQLVVVGARTGVGKSLILINLAVHAARAGVRAALFSLEMTRDEVADRILAATAGVPLERLTSHQLTDWDWNRVREGREKLRGVRLYVDDRPGASMAAVRGRCRDLSRETPPVGLVVVDYLQLVSPADARVDRRQQVDAISRELKLLGKDLGVPVVAAAQLNRQIESRSSRVPVLADLRESGSLEQDADVVLLAHRGDDHPGELQITVAKNRGGPTGRTIPLAWSPSTARLSDLRRGPRVSRHDPQAYLEAVRRFLLEAREHLDDPTYAAALPLLDQLRTVPDLRDPFLEDA